MVLGHVMMKGDFVVVINLFNPRLGFFGRD